MVSNQVENPDIDVQGPPKENGAAEVKAEKTVRRRASAKTAEKKEAAGEKSAAEKIPGEEKPARTRSVKHQAEGAAEKKIGRASCRERV